MKHHSIDINECISPSEITIPNKLKDSLKNPSFREENKIKTPFDLYKYLGYSHFANKYRSSRSLDLAIHLIQGI